MIVLPCRHVFCNQCVVYFQQRLVSTCLKCRGKISGYEECQGISLEFLGDDNTETAGTGRLNDSFIFLSYAWGKKDSNTQLYPDQEFVKQIKSRLEQEGYKVWMDIYKLGVGNLYENLQNAIDSSSVIIFLINDNYITSPNCLHEFHYAHELINHYNRAKKKDPAFSKSLTPIPVFLKSYSLPELKYGIGFLLNSSLRINAYPAWKESTYDTLLRYIRENIASSVCLETARRQEINSKWNELSLAPTQAPPLSTAAAKDSENLSGRNDILLVLPQHLEKVVDVIEKKMHETNQSLVVSHQIQDALSNLLQSKIDDSKITMCLVNQETLQSSSFIDCIKYATSRLKRTSCVIFGDFDLSKLRNGNGFLISSLDNVKVSDVSEFDVKQCETIATKANVSFEFLIFFCLVNYFLNLKQELTDITRVTKSLSSNGPSISQTGHVGSVNALVVNKEGFLFSGGADKTIRKWDLKSVNNCLKILTGHTRSVNTLATIDPENLLVSGGNDNQVIIWNMSECVAIRNLSGHAGSVNSICGDDQKRLFSGSWDKTIRCWRVETGECFKILEGHENTIKALLLTSKRDQLVSSSFDKCIRVWSLADLRCVSILKGHTGSVHSLAIDNSNTLFSGSNDNSIKVWNLNTFECVRTIHGHSGSVLSLAINQVSNCIIAGLTDKTIKSWDIKTGDLVQTLDGHSDWVNAIQIDQKTPTIIISGSDDSTIRLWNKTTGQCLAIIGKN